jgi:hypothetical protein
MKVMKAALPRRMDDIVYMPGLLLADTDPRFLAARPLDKRDVRGLAKPPVITDAGYSRRVHGERPRRIPVSRGPRLDAALIEDLASKPPRQALSR